LSGVVANGLTSLISGTYNRLKGQVASTSESQARESLTRQIRSALEDVSDTVEWAGPPRVEEVCLFITSPEAEAVVRQLYAANLFTEQKKTADDIREEFRRLYAIRFGLEYEDSK